MTKKKYENKINLNKWIRVLLWFFGIVLGLLLVFLIGFKVWVSTWQTYRSDQFGFSFQYPSNWYMGGTDITKKQLSETQKIFFWVDKEKPEKVEGITETIRSSGNVQVSIGLPDGSIERKIDFMNKYGFTYKNIIYGNKYGYTLFANFSSGKNSYYPKSILLKSNNYLFDLDLNEQSPDNKAVNSIQKSFYNWVGGYIMKSFKFD